jgi:GAF domain-containing protein
VAASADIDGEAAGRVLTAVSDAVAAITANASLERVLYKLAKAAQDLAGATCAAVGVPEPEGDTFARFITVGMSDELVDRLGPLPRTHGLLAAILNDSDPYRTQDITQDPRFRGWWPGEHPKMRSLLGVPIVARGRVIGALYLTDKQDGGSFSAEAENRTKHSDFQDSIYGGAEVISPQSIVRLGYSKGEDSDFGAFFGCW